MYFAPFSAAAKHSPRPHRGCCARGSRFRRRSLSAIPRPVLPLAAGPWLRRVDDVDDVGTVGLQFDGLLGRAPASSLWLIIRKHITFSPAPGPLDRLLAAVCLGAVHGDSNSLDARVDRTLQFAKGRDARYVEDRDVGVLYRPDRSPDILGIGGGGEPVLDGRRAQSDAVRDLDRGDPCPVESRGNRGDVVGGELVRHARHAVPQRRVDQDDLPIGVFVGHCAAPVTRFCWAMTSATCTAAAVMMSRLPAYVGRKSPAPTTSSMTVTRSPSTSISFSE